MDLNTIQTESEVPPEKGGPAAPSRRPQPLSKRPLPRQTLFSQIRTAFRFPSLWLTLALIFTVLEGALRKWVNPFGSGQGEILAYFSKDILFSFALVVAVGKGLQFSAGLYTVKLWLTASLLCTGAGFLLSLDPNLNLTGAALSFRALVALPLIALIVAAGWRGFPLEGFAIITVILVTGNAALALLQSTLPPYHILNHYADDTMMIVEVDSGVRATGTFAYITGLSIVASVGVWAGMVLISLHRSRWHLLTGALGILSGFACAFSSVSRGTLLTVGAMLAIWILSGPRKVKIIFGLTLSTIAIAAVLAVFFPAVLQRFDNVRLGTLDRFESAGDDNTARALGQWTELAYAISSTPLGGGLGSEQTGAKYAAVGTRGFNTYESQFPRIVAEIGIFGIIGFFLLVGSVIFGLQKLKGGKEHTPWNMTLVATQVLVLGVAYGSLVFNHTASAFVWIIVAVVFATSQQTDTALRTRARVARPQAGEIAVKPVPEDTAER